LGILLLGFTASAIEPAFGFYFLLYSAYKIIIFLMKRFVDEALSLAEKNIIFVVED